MSQDAFYNLLRTTTTALAEGVPQLMPDYISRSDELLKKLNDIKQDSFELEFRSEIEGVLSTLDTSLKRLNPGSEPFSVEKKTKFSDLSRKHSTVSFLASHVKVKIEYSTTSQVSGMWWWKRNREAGTVLFESELTKEVVRFSLLKIEDVDHIPEADIHRVITCLESFVIANNLSVQDEHNLLRGLNKACASQIFSYNYSLYREEHGYLAFQRKLHVFYRDTETALDLFRDDVLSRLDALESKLDGKDVSKILTTYIDAKQLEVDDLSSKIEATFISERDRNLQRLTAEEETFNKKLAVREISFEKKCKLADKKQKKRSEELEERYKAKYKDLEKKQQETESLRIALSAKLKDHRTKVHEEFYKIAPKLTALFPDAEAQRSSWNRRSAITYETKVDGDLRTFYTQKLKSKIEDNAHTTVDECLQLISFLKDNCFDRNRRPRGCDVRKIFIGAYCVLAYLAEHDVPFSKIISLITENGRKDGPKVNIEHLIEQSLGCDFNMKRFKADIHGKDVKDRKGLKIK